MAKTLLILSIIVLLLFAMFLLKKKSKKGLIRVKVEGEKNISWVDPNDLKGSEYHHPPFGKQRMAVLKEIKKLLNEVYPMSLAGWEDGFRRDMHPEREMFIWLSVARCYSNVAKEFANNENIKKEIFNVLGACMINGEEYAKNNLEINLLTKEQAEFIIKEYFNTKWVPN